VAPDAVARDEGAVALLMTYDQTAWKGKQKNNERNEQYSVAVLQKSHFQ
jgi:hypothetical protein